MRLAGLIAALALAGAAPAAAQNAPDRPRLSVGETLLEVEAEGEHLSRPDVMTISAGVETTGRTTGEALDANSRLANRLIETVRSRNVAPRDVRTEALRIRPILEERKDAEGDDDEDEQEPKIIGYRATNTLQLRLRDLTAAPQLIDALLAAGANSIEGPWFSLSDEAPALRAARQAAVKLARAKAEEYAEAFDMRIVRVLRVSERRSWAQSRDEEIVVTGATGGPPIEPGEVETSVTVWVDFALAPR